MAPFLCNMTSSSAYNWYADVFVCGDNMPDNYNMFDRIGGSIQKKKLEKALEMFHNESPQELRRRLGNISTEEILEKISEYDSRKLSQMGINLDELRNKITERDFQKLMQVLGPEGSVIVQKLKALLK